MIIINILNEINTIIASAFKTNFILYHGCPSTECYDSIRKHGLIPKINKDTKPPKKHKIGKMRNIIFCVKDLLNIKKTQKIKAIHHLLPEL